jgi:hypothetical protein
MGTPPNRKASKPHIGPIVKHYSLLENIFFSSYQPCGSVDDAPNGNGKNLSSFCLASAARSDELSIH